MSDVSGLIVPPMCHTGNDGSMGWQKNGWTFVFCKLGEGMKIPLGYLIGKNRGENFTFNTGML